MANRSEEIVDASDAGSNIPRQDVPYWYSNNPTPPVSFTLREPLNPDITGNSLYEILYLVSKQREMNSISEALERSHISEPPQESLSLSGPVRRNSQRFTLYQEQPIDLTRGRPYPSMRSEVNSLSNAIESTHISEPPLASLSGPVRRNREPSTSNQEEPIIGITRTRPYSSVGSLRSQVNSLPGAIASTHTDAPSPTPACARLNPRRRDPRLRSMTQILILEEAFKKTMFPNRSLRANLASSVGLSDYQVMMWFEDRRARWYENAGLSQSADTDSSDSHPTLVHDEI